MKHAPPRQPSEFNNGAGGVSDTSEDKYKLLPFARPGVDFDTIYIGVLNQPTAEQDGVQAEFTIQVFLDML